MDKHFGKIQNIPPETTLAELNKQMEKMDESLQKAGDDQGVVLEHKPNQEQNMLTQIRNDITETEPEDK